MCGIAGFAAPGLARETALKQVRRMLAMIRHRGPDASGACADDGIGKQVLLERGDA
jgi:asparagine synthetase B (glutamine-hydrolysing)